MRQGIAGEGLSLRAAYATLECEKDSLIGALMKVRADVFSRFSSRSVQDYTGDHTMPFLPVLELSRRLNEDVIHLLLERYFPDLSYAAARIGPGSDVIGFDTEMSMDHDWGRSFSSSSSGTRCPSCS